MKRFTSSLLQSDRTRHRSGATLTEVLMSLMIMAIGVVSLATLFPISAQRVLEATNLTNSTVVRFNAEGLVDSYPTLVHNPDGIAATREGGRNYQVDPLGWYELLQQTGSNPVRYEYNRPSAITQPLLNLPNGQPLQTRYLGENSASPQLFAGIDIARALVGLPDTATDVADCMPDPDGTNAGAYVLNGEGRLSGIVLPPEVDLTTVALEPSLYRITLRDKTGKYSEVRQVTYVSGQQVSWDQNGSGSADFPGEDLPLPTLFTSNVGHVRIDQPTPDYSWLLTVRKRVSGPANIDVVVFRKRDFSELSEQYYIGPMRRYTLGADGAPGAPGVDDNQNGTVDDATEIGYPLPTALAANQDQPNNRVVVDWTAGNYTTAPERPPIRRGGYVFDLVNGLWYRIQGIEAHVDPASGVEIETAATLILETAIARDNSEDLSGDGTLGDVPGEDRNNNNVLDQGGLIIPKGVVAVFPLETKIP